MDVLVNSNYDENPDELMSFLSLLFQVLNEYNNKNYGEVIRILRSVRKSLPYGKSISVFDRSLLKIELHEDKIKLKEKLDFFVKVLESSDLLGTVLQKLVENKIISSDFYNFIFLYEKNGEFLYTDLFCYSVELFKLIDEYNRNPMVSTQHGVKGEEHKKILFVSENSNTPGIKIYEFLNLFTSFYAQNIAFNFDDFQAFYYNFNRDVLLLEEKIGQKLRNIKVSDTLSFQEKTATKDMKIIFNNNLVRSTLTAYKLFYVGCSRAEEELVVLIDENQIENMQEFKSCFKQIGFQINC